MNNLTSGVDVCGKLVLLSYDKGGPYTKKFCADLLLSQAEDLHALVGL